MSTDDLVDAEKLSNVIAVVIGIGIAAEALVEAFFDFFEYVIVLLLEKTLEDLANKTYVKFKKFSTLFFCLGFGIGTKKTLYSAINCMNHMEILALNVQFAL